MSTRAVPVERISFKQIWDSQDLSGTATPLLRYVAIPAAWPLTWLFLHIGFHPNVVTTIRFAVAILVLPLIVLPQATYYAIGLISFAIAIVLDQVDGQICRIKNQASYFGKFYDGLTDAVTEIPLPTLLGLHLWLRDDAVHSLITGFAASAALALMYIVLLRYGLISQWVKGSVPNAPASHHPRLRRVLDRPFMKGVSSFVNVRMIVVLNDVRYCGLIVAVVTDQLAPYLLLFFVLHCMAIAALVPLRLLDAYDRYDIHRYSHSAANQRASREAI